MVLTTFVSILFVVMSFAQFELLKILLVELEEDLKEKEEKKEMKQRIKKIVEMHIELTE